MPHPQPAPDEIWNAAAEEGERRVGRGWDAVLSAAFVGGADVMIGVAAMVSVAGALAMVMEPRTADVLGAFVFGIGFVAITIGRGELLTENFLIPFAAAFRKRATTFQLTGLYVRALIGNLIGVVLFAWMLSLDKVLDHGALQAAGRYADVYASRPIQGAFFSAVIAGAVITLWTWLTEACDSDMGRITVAFLIGLVVAVGSLNHVIVVTGTMVFGKLGGEAVNTQWIDIYRNFAVAIVGNVVGGFGFVTLTRVVQARSEDG